MELFEAPRPLSQVIEKTEEEIFADFYLLGEISQKKTELPVKNYPYLFAE